MEEVTAAFLQVGTMLPGCSQTETTLNETRVKGIKMFWDGTGLLINIKNKEGFIPAANIRGVWFKEVRAAKKATK